MSQTESFKMLKRKRLRFGNIGRFVQPQEIDFTSKGRLVQIGGENKNSNGSSGAGKSTFLEATDINLGISKIPSTIYQSRYSKETAWTEGDYEANGIEFTVKRGGGKKTSIHWKGLEGEGEITGDSAKADEKILEILGMEPELFRRMTHKAQKEDGFFLSLTPSQSFSFMMKVLGLDEILKKLDKVDGLITASEKAVTGLQNELNILGSKVNDQTEIIAKLRAEPLPIEPDLSMLETALGIMQMRSEELMVLKLEEETLLRTLQKEEDQIKAEIANTEAAALAEIKVRAPIKAASLPIPPRVEELQIEARLLNEEVKLAETGKTDKIIQLQKAIDGLRQQKNQSDYAFKKKQDYLVLIEKKKEELNHLNDRTCPTCKQKWLGLDMEAHIKNLQVELDTLKSKVVDCEQQIEAATGVQEKIDRAGNILTTLQASTPGADIWVKIAALQVERQKLLDEVIKQNADLSTKFLEESLIFNKEVETIKAFYAQKLEESRQNIILKRNQETERLTKAKATTESNLSSARLEVSALELAKTQYEMAKNSLEKNLLTNQQYLDKNLADFNNKNAEYQTAQSEFLINTETKRLLKSFTNKKFEEALETIGREATARLNKIPNMATASIYFESFKEVKGKIKEEITVILSMDGDVGIPLKSLSGGERSAADLAVDLAVADFIEEHSGMGADYLVLDEPCAGMDTVCKQEYIEMLKTMSTNKQIFIVEHSSEIKEMVDDTILVVREGLYSEIQQ